MYPNNWGEYEIYIWTILWFFWLTPFWINELTAWTNHSLSSLWLFDIWILPLKGIFIIIWNLLIYLFIYFVFFYLVFRNDLKKLLPKQFSVNKFIDKILKWFSIVIYYLVYLKILVIILSLLINHTLGLNHWF